MGELQPTSVSLFLVLSIDLSLFLLLAHIGFSQIANRQFVAFCAEISKEAVLCLERAFERTLQLGKTATLARCRSKSLKEGNLSPQP